MMKGTQLLLTFVIPLAFALACRGEQNKLAKDLQTTRSGTVDVVLQVNTADLSQNLLKEIRNLGGNVTKSLKSVKGAAVSLPAGALALLAVDPEVKYISPDRAVKAALDYTAPAVAADLAWRCGFDGKGIGIAIIDSGIADHPDLQGVQVRKSRIVYQQTLVGGSADDTYGHGTHIAGIVAGNGNGSGVKFRGLAPAANLINFRVLDGSGAGRDSGVIAAIEQAIALKNTYNIRVINLSLGRPVMESYLVDPLCRAVETAWNAGIVVVVAAGNFGRDNSFGNEGYGTITSPGNDPFVITVGAMKTMNTPSRTDDLIASYSSKGPTAIDHIVKPDLVAPGNRVASLKPPNTSRKEAAIIAAPVFLSEYMSSGTGQDSPLYYRLSGSSMASPVVSGAAALLLQKDPSLAPDQVKARLMKTASKAFPSFSVAYDPVTGQSFRSQYDIFTVGAGYIDIAAALANTDVAFARAASPTAVYDASTGTVRILTGSAAVWGTAAVWGSSAVWGTAAVWGSSVLLNGSSALWGTAAVWGSATTQGFSAVWGSGAVWGASSMASAESVRLTRDGEN